MPKLNNDEVIVPGSRALHFDIDLSGGHANNFLIQNVSRALVSEMVVKFESSILEETDNYSTYKIFSDLFLPGEKQDNMVPVSRAKICARSTQVRETKKPLELLLKTN